MSRGPEVEAAISFCERELLKLRERNASDQSRADWRAMQQVALAGEMRFTTSGPIFPPGVIEREFQRLEALALEGDSDADRVLRDAVIYRLESGIELPEVLRDYAVTILDSGDPPRRKRGKSSHANNNRNWAIAQLLHSLRRGGFLPTRNEASGKNMSGSAIVAEAATRAGMPIGERAVEKIWEKLGQRFTHLNRSA